MFVQRLPALNPPQCWDDVRWVCQSLLFCAARNSSINKSKFKWNKPVLPQYYCQLNWETDFSFPGNFSLRNQPSFCNTTTGFPAKWYLGNARRNSILERWRQTSDSSWEFLRIENKHIKTVQNSSYVFVFVLYLYLFICHTITIITKRCQKNVRRNREEA